MQKTKRDKLWMYAKIWIMFMSWTKIAKWAVLTLTSVPLTTNHVQFNSHRIGHAQKSCFCPPILLSFFHNHHLSRTKISTVINARNTIVLLLMVHFKGEKSIINASKTIVLLLMVHLKGERIN